jgi:hypothetical protein
MPQEHIQTVHDLIKIISNNPAYVLFIIGSATGFLWWSLHRIFATQETMERCKDEVISALHKHAREEHVRAEQQRTEYMEVYNDLKEDIRVITAHLFKPNG